MSVFEPWVGKRIGEFSTPKLPNLNFKQFKSQPTEPEEPQAPQGPATVQKKELPTPANTGAPLPGHRQRTNITPQSTGAPMPKSEIKPLPVKHTRSYPKMNKKQTAPGTRPKKR